MKEGWMRNMLMGRNDKTMGVRLGNGEVKDMEMET